YHTGTPRHFHSSTTSGSASLISFLTRASVSPRQSPSSAIRASISCEGDSAPFTPLFAFAMALSLSSGCVVHPSPKHGRWGKLSSRLLTAWPRLRHIIEVLLRHVERGAA